jgi:hypothetical protein
MQAFFGRHNPPDGFYSQERYSKEQLTAESATHFDHYTRNDRVEGTASKPGTDREAGGGLHCQSEMRNSGSSGLIASCILRSARNES